MFIPLVTIFVVALCIMLVGLYLSPKPGQQKAPQLRQRKGTTRDLTTTNMTRKLPAGTTRQLAAGNTRQLTGGVRPRRSIDGSEYENWGNARTGVLASPQVRTSFGQSIGNLPHWLQLLIISVLIFGTCLFLFAHSLLFNSTTMPMSWMDQLPPPNSTPAAAPAPADPPSPFAGLTGESQTLARLGQLDPNQYVSKQEFDTWAESACSATAMTEVINAYNHNYRITDVLKVESDIGEISPTLGLLEAQGIERTVTHFGFKGVQLKNVSLDSMLEVANKGVPIIIGFPPRRPHWPGGHILVLRGGAGDNVFLADSSQFNITTMTRARFMQDWGGFAVLVTPDS